LGKYNQTKTNYRHFLEKITIKTTEFSGVKIHKEHLPDRQKKSQKKATLPFERVATIVCF